MREGVTLSSKNEKERVYYGKITDTLVEADRALSEYKALVDVKRYHGKISSKEAANKINEFLNVAYIEGYPKPHLYAYSFAPEKVFNGTSGPDGTTGITSSWYKLLCDVEKGKYSDSDATNIKAAFMQVVCHEAAYHDFRFFTREHIFPSDEIKLKNYINECYADMRAAEMMNYKASRAAEIFKYRVKNVYKDDPESEKDYLRHPSYKLRIEVLRSGYFDKSTVFMLAKHIGANEFVRNKVLRELELFAYRHPDVHMKIAL